jgi:hypothetical protein
MVDSFPQSGRLFTFVILVLILVSIEVLWAMY